MSYDKNGNMIKDLDREFVTIRYNILNLPDTVQFKNGNQIINRYSADGSKLSTIYFTRVTAITSPIIPGKVCNWTHTPGTVIKSGKDIVQISSINSQETQGVLVRSLIVKDMQSRLQVILTIITVKII